MHRQAAMYEAQASRRMVDGRATLRCVGIWLLAWVAIAIWRWEIVDSPPYQDQTVGWQEAHFLATTHFDYYRLRYAENHWLDREQGCRNYMTSVLPSVWAALMTTLPTPRAVFIAAHVFNFGLAAGMLCGVWMLVRRWVDPLTAALTLAALATTPLVTVQIDMVGLDLPMACCAVWSVWGALERRWWFACLAGWGAFWMKPTGSIAHLAALLPGAREAWRDRHDGAKRRSAWQAILLPTASLAGQALIVLWADSLPNSVRSSEALGGLNWQLAPLLCPDLLLLLFIALWGSLGLLIRTWHRLGASGVFQEGSLGEYLACGWLMIAATWWATRRVLFIPRYLTLAEPFAWIVVACLLGRTPRGLRWGVLALAVTLNTANREGRWFPDIRRGNAEYFAEFPDVDPFSNAFLERSREYLDDHRATLAGCRVLEQRVGAGPVFACNPFTRYLSLPCLGYVTKSLYVYNCNYLVDAVRQWRCVMAQHDAGSLTELPTIVWRAEAQTILPAPGPADAIFFDDRPGHGWLIFQASLRDVPRDDAALDDWFLARSQTDDAAPGRLIHRIGLLAETGRWEQADDEAQRTRQAYPGNQSAARIAENVRRRLGVAWRDRHLSPALWRCDRRLATSLGQIGLTAAKGSSAAKAQMGECPPRLQECHDPWMAARDAVREGRWQDAVVALAALHATTRDENRGLTPPARPEISARQEELGVVESAGDSNRGLTPPARRDSFARQSATPPARQEVSARQVDADVADAADAAAMILQAAQGAWEAVRELRPDGAKNGNRTDLQAVAAMAELAQGHFHTAETELRECLQQAPNNPLWLQQLAVALMRQGRRAEAAAPLATALSKAPGDPLLRRQYEAAASRAMGKEAP